MMCPIEWPCQDEPAVLDLSAGSWHWQASNCKEANTADNSIQTNSTSSGLCPSSSLPLATPNAHFLLRTASEKTTRHQSVEKIITSSCDRMRTYYRGRITQQRELQPIQPLQYQRLGLLLP
jgi:hypothetical protein